MPGETTIDSLQIEIQAGAKDAEQGLDALKGALDKLRSALKDGAGLTSLASSFRNMGDEANKLGTTSAANIEKLVQALRDLQGVGKLNLTETANGIEKVNKSSEKAAATSGSVVKRLLVTYASLRGIGRTIASLIDKSNTYVENLNLFNASLGQYADSARDYAQQVADLMGIDPAQWLRTQGVFQTLAEGFGVTSDRAIIMSKNLTQLGYDLSSFFNIAVDGVGGSMQKLQAAFSGELEPLRRLGFDLSEARLKAVALSLGIDQTFNSMTQAQKAQLRYYAILTQVTTAQGDMARTLDTPANQLRIFKAQVEQAGRALGNIFIPALNAILPYAIAATQAIRMVADAIATLVGFELPTIDYSGLEGATNATDDLDSALTSASGSAKKLKDLLADWDELNIIQNESGGGSGKGGKSTYNAEDWTFDLPEYDFLKEFASSRVSQILEGWKPTIQWITDHIKQISQVAEAIGGTLLAWTLAGGLIGDLSSATSYLSTLLGAVGVITTVTGSIVMNISFTTNWLETGNWGSLFGEVITSLGGASLAAAIIKHIIKGEKGTAMADWAAGTILTVNGAIGIALSVKKASIDGLDEKTMLRMLTGGLEVAGGTALIYRQVAKWLTGTPASAAQSIGVGAAAFFAAANIGLNISLTEGYLQSGDPIKILETVGTDALSAAGIGAAVGMTFKSAKAGFIVTGIALAADAAMDLILNVGDVVENGITRANIWNAIKGTLEAAAGAGLITSYGLKGKLEMGTAAWGAASAFSAAVGIGVNTYLTKAALNDTSAAAGMQYTLPAILSDTFTSYFSGLSVYKATGSEKYAWVVTGVSLAVNAAITTVEVSDKVAESGKFDGPAVASSIKSIIETTIAGASIGMSVGNPGAGALVGLAVGLTMTATAVLTGLENHTTAIPEMKYGEGALTPEDVQTYVNGLYEFDVTAQVNSITAVVDANAQVKTKVDQKFKVLQSQLKILELGVDTDASYEEIKESLTGTGGLISMLNTLMEEQTNVIKLWVTIGSNDTSKLASDLGTILTADQLITNELTWAGEQFATYITKGMDQQLTKEETAMRDSLLEFITNVTTAALQGQAQGQFEASVAALHLKDMSQNSISEVLSSYAGYASDLWSNLTNLQTETMAGMYSKRATYAAAVEDWQKAHPGETAPNELPDAIAALDESIADLKANWDLRLHEAYDPMVANGNTQLFGEIWSMILSDDTLDKAIADRFEKYSWQISEYQQDAGDILDQFIKEVGVGIFDQYTNGGFSTWQEQFTKMGMGDMFNQMLTSVTMSALKGDARYSWMYENFELPMDIQNAITPVLDNTEFNAQLAETQSSFNGTVAEMNQNGKVYMTITPQIKSALLPSYMVPTVMRAEGGTVSTGELFVAREAGPEMVGRIGRSTAVANNDQIVSGITGGVRQAQQDQNALLQEQNRLLRAILSKTGKIEPSTALARTLKRSNEMLVTADGVL